MTKTDSRPAAPAMPGWRGKMHEVIFEADTVAGKLFDVLLLIAIVLSIVVVMLDSVDSISKDYKSLLRAAEWLFTILFTVEYVVRLMCVRRPLRYTFSFFGVVDLLAILPTFVSLMLPGSGSQSLLVIRSLRLLRVFRIFKLARFLSEATALRQAVWASRAKITVFIATVMMAVIIMGSAMYLIEGQVESGFTSIPQSMYWAIVTMTTVGYGDIAPVTTLGKIVAAIVMIMGYSMIIIPTGIISAEMIQAGRHSVTTQSCPHCMAEDHASDAAYCRICGGKL
jgi:voltage-gated potassium channel